MTHADDARLVAVVMPENMPPRWSPAQERRHSIEEDGQTLAPRHACAARIGVTDGHEANNHHQGNADEKPGRKPARNSAPMERLVIEP